VANTSGNPGNVREQAESAASTAAHQAGQAASNVGQRAQETASNLGQRAQEAASSLAHQASQVASNVGQHAQDAASGAAERTDDAISSVGQGMASLAGTLRHNVPREGMLGTAADRVADRLEAGGQYLQEHGLNDMGDDLSGLIRQHPLPSMLAVFGLGFLLGSALRR